MVRIAGLEQLSELIYSEEKVKHYYVRLSLLCEDGLKTDLSGLPSPIYGAQCMPWPRSIKKAKPQKYDLTEGFPNEEAQNHRESNPGLLLMGTIGGTRITTLEVKLKDRRNTTISASRCQGSLTLAACGVTDAKAVTPVPHTKCR